jgi:hypothetical protein
MPWKRMLAYITGSVNKDLLRRIEYPLEENRVLRHQIDRRILLTVCYAKPHSPPVATLSASQCLSRPPRAASPRTGAGGAGW